MNIQKTTEDFNILNILIYVVLYMLIIGFFIGFYTLPLIKTFKNSQAEYKSNLKHYNSLLNRYKSLKKSFEKKKNKNMEIIKKFRNVFNEKDFSSFSSNYFSNVSFKNVSDTYKNKKKEEGFLVKKYRMDFSFLKMKSFYGFIQDLEKYPAVIKINFPVVLEKKINEKHIKGNWKISVYEKNTSI